MLYHFNFSLHLISQEFIHSRQSPGHAWIMFDYVMRGYRRALRSQRCERGLATSAAGEFSRVRRMSMCSLESSIPVPQAARAAIPAMPASKNRRNRSLSPGRCASQERLPGVPAVLLPENPKLGVNLAGCSQLQGGRPAQLTARETSFAHSRNLLDSLNVAVPSQVLKHGPSGTVAELLPSKSLGCIDGGGSSV